MAAGGEEEEEGREKIVDYKTSMITDEDPLRGVAFFTWISISLTLQLYRGTSFIRKRPPP